METQLATVILVEFNRKSPCLVYFLFSALNSLLKIYKIKHLIEIKSTVKHKLVHLVFHRSKMFPLKKEKKKRRQSGVTFSHFLLNIRNLC